MVLNNWADQFLEGINWLLSRFSSEKVFQFMALLWALAPAPMREGSMLTKLSRAFKAAPRHIIPTGGQKCIDTLLRTTILELRQSFQYGPQFQDVTCAICGVFGHERSKCHVLIHPSRSPLPPYPSGYDPVRRDRDGMADLVALAPPSSLPPPPPHNQDNDSLPAETARAPAPHLPPATPPADEIAPLTAASLQPLGRGRARRRALSPAQGRPGAVECRRHSCGPLRVNVKSGKMFYLSSTPSPPPNCPSEDFVGVPNDFPCNWAPQNTNWVEVEAAEFGSLHDIPSTHSISVNIPPPCDDVCSHDIDWDVLSPSHNTISHASSPVPSTRSVINTASPTPVARDAVLESFFDNDAIEGVRILFDTASDPLPASASASSASSSSPSAQKGRRKSRNKKKRLTPRMRRGRHHIEHWYARALLPDVPPDPFQQGRLVLPYSIQPGSKLRNDILQRRGSPVPQRRNSTHPLLGWRFPSPVCYLPNHTPLVAGRALIPLLHHTWSRCSPNIVSARGIHFLVDSGTPHSVLPHWLHTNLVQRNAPIEPDGSGLFRVTFTTGSADVPLHVRVAGKDEKCTPTIGLDDIQRLALRVEPSSQRACFTPPAGPRTYTIADFEPVTAPAPQDPPTSSF